MNNATDISYSGSVLVNVNVNGKIVNLHKHNRGLPTLFKMITKALAGFNIEKEKPSYVDLRYATSETATEWQSCLSKKQSVSQIYFSMENGSWVTRVSAMIPYAVLVGNTIQDSGLEDNKIFRLYLSNYEADLAYISVERSELETIKPGTQALVEWVLKFSNLGE